MKLRYSITVAIALTIALGLTSYAYFPKRTEIVCIDFVGYRKAENNATVDWFINTIRISLINSKFSLQQYSPSMLSYIVDSSTVHQLLKDSNNPIDATLEGDNLLTLFVPTPQSNYGMLSMKVDVVAGSAHISTWEYAGGAGNGILNGSCKFPIALSLLEKLQAGFGNFIK